MTFDDLKIFGKTFLELNEICYNNDCDFNISTITYTFSLDHTNIDLLQFSNKFDVNNVCIKPCKKRKKTKIQRNDFFFNQITIEYLTMSKKSIKIFKNGRVHVTGLCSLYDCNHVTQLVCEWLELVFEEKYKVIDLSKKIDLLNSTLNFKKSFSFKTLINILISKNIQYVYHPDTYSAIKIIYSTSKIMIFKSGNVILSAKESILNIKYSLFFFLDLINLYKRIDQSFEKEFHIKKQNKYVNNNRDQSCKYFDGYLVKDLLSSQIVEIE